ncbi:MAG: AIR synthase-related protein, partial [Nitrospinota bacterium]
QKNIASSCIDISDGIFQDLGHLLNASRVGAQVEWKLLPIDRALIKKKPTAGMIGFGEDYELLFTVPKSNLKRLSPIEKEITRIGEITSKGLIVLDKNGKEMNITNVGYSHFT